MVDFHNVFTLTGGGLASCMLGAVPESTGYFSIFKIILILLLIFPWLKIAPWVDKDTKVVHLPRTLWNLLVISSGMVSLLLWLLLPWFAVGLLLYIVFTTSTILTYALIRDKRVVPEAKVLTSRHLKSVFTSGKSERVETIQRVKIYDHTGRPVGPPPEEQIDERITYNLAQNFLHDVVLFRASEVDLMPAKTQTAVKFVVDGVGHNRPPMEIHQAEKLIDFIKKVAGMNVEEKRRPQSGKIAVEAGAVTVDMDINTAGTMQGQRLQIHIVQETAKTNLSELGMSEDILAKLEELNKQKGLIIVSGPRGNGVTSTLYSLLRRHDAYIENLATIEEHITIDLENVTQIEYTDQTDMPAKLASLLRRDPDVVMVDACRTPQAAQLICDASQEKQILLGSTASSALVALAKWVKVVGDAQKAVAPLKAITCQVLLRKLCPNCKESYSPRRDLLAKLNLPVEKIGKFYRPPTKPLTDEKGNPIVCPTCRGTGYYGRTGAFELLEMTDEIRQLVIQGAPVSKIKAACRKNKMLYLQEQCLMLVIKGITSVEEVIRVTSKMNKK